MVTWISFFPTKGVKVIFNSHIHLIRTLVAIMLCTSLVWNHFSVISRICCIFLKVIHQVISSFSLASHLSQQFIYILNKHLVIKVWAHTLGRLHILNGQYHVPFDTQQKHTYMCDFTHTHTHTHTHSHTLTHTHTHTLTHTHTHSLNHSHVTTLCIHVPNFSAGASHSSEA